MPKRVSFLDLEYFACAVSCAPYGTLFLFCPAYPGLTSGANICRRSAAGVLWLILTGRSTSSREKAPPFDYGQGGLSRKEREK